MIQKKKTEEVKKILDAHLIKNSDALSEQLYFQMIKPLVDTLIGLKEDAEMAMSGEWDCTTEEGIETGFGAQITMIEQVL